MLTEREKHAVGCLVIGNGMSGEDALSGLSSFLDGRGVYAVPFCPARGERLHLALQRAYQRVRARSRLSAIVAAGAGCDAATAIAGQLPVDRLVLLTGDSWGDFGLLAAPVARQMRRIRAFARRNAVFCVSEVMLLQFGQADRGHDIAGLSAALCNCSVCGARLGRFDWPERKKDLMNAVCGYLCSGVLPKYLAENPEMCIIYE